MASPFAQRIAGVLKGGLTPPLRARGFRKEGCVFVAEHDDVVWLVDVQKSRWNDGDEAQFTVNGGVYVPGIVSGYSGRPEPAKPKLADCCLSVRIGMLDESRIDKWWKVTASDDLQDAVDEGIAAEVRDRVEGLLLHFLQSFESRAVVAEFLAGSTDIATRFVSPQAAAQRHAYASLIYSGLGNSAKAQSEIELAMREAEGSPIEGVIRRLRERLVSGNSGTVNPPVA